MKEALQANPMRILVVDDEPLNLEIISHTLEKGGHESECVPDGARALGILSANPDAYDIVLLDRMMPIMGGMEVLTRLKQHPRLRNIPVIMQTAASSRSQIEEGIRSGAYYYLTKPFTSRSLLSVVEAAASNIEAARTKREAAGRKALVEDTEHCYFEIRTPEEAELTALYVANLTPDPDRVISGIRELLMNAIIHGHLEMDVEECRTLTAHHTLGEEVNRLLKLPEHTKKKVEVDFRKDKEGIELTIKDDGKGFDWQRYIHMESAKITGPGKHLALIRERCFDRIEYPGNGNEVRCTLTPEGQKKKALALASISDKW